MRVNCCLLGCSWRLDFLTWACLTSPPKQRGWVFQEGIFPARVLHYGFGAGEGVQHPAFL
ncbi:hypothetical protein K432DRAFT_382800 [Lepidopterella palustris CBS 459.81]|uniref:Uncharacterized protein n=1 Tax=Lepidopterella palustris CBS 459.81 TaxID=1314670 RepID=A0A8E2E9H3_9PEZI|nr:hypothetical protein K432DRAFT_382800 [Lepidopterella palustris CBS 459.81]